MTPDEYCQDKLAAHASSVHYSLLFAPAARRRAATALYALLAEIDEAAERVSDPNVARATLGWWAQEIERMFDGAPQHPVTRALQSHVAAYGLHGEPFIGSLHARLHLLEPAPFGDFDALARYCYLAAGPFAHAAATMFGASDADADHARELALAVQLIRLLRDSGRHARNGRIVFPMQELREFDVKPEQLASAVYASGFEALAGRQAGRARAALRAAAAQLPRSQRRAQAPGIILGTLYEALLDELQHSSFRVLHQRIALTPIRKLLIAWRTWVFGPPRGGAMAQ